MSPMLSIVVPVYNAASSVIQTLQSLVAQSTRDFELVIVDDGSTDQSVNIIKDFLLDKNINYLLITQENQGVSVARNNGLHQSTAPYVLFLDSDDILFPEIVETTTNIIKSNPDLIFFNHKIREENASKNSDIVTISRSGMVPNSITTINDYLLFKKNRIRFNITSVIFQKELLIKNKIFFEQNYRHGEDSHFILNAMFRSSSIYLSESFSFTYCIRKGSVTQSIKLNGFDGFYALLNLSTSYMNSVDSPIKYNALQFRAMNSFTIHYFKILNLHKEILNPILRIKTVNSLIKEKYPNIFYDFSKGLISSRKAIYNFKMAIYYIVFIAFGTILKL
jgi:glycosyltransferase involved in cell wall biosynthesis